MKNIVVTPNFHFNGECEKALDLYEKAFGGRLTALMRYSDAGPDDFSTEGLSDEERSYIYHAEMEIGTQRFMFSDNIGSIPKGQNISIVLTFEHPDDIRRAYNILCDGCTIICPLCERTYSSCFVSLVDRFGNRWELMTETASQ